MSTPCGRLSIQARQYWARLEAWAAAETPADRAERTASEAEWDTLMDGDRGAGANVRTIIHRGGGRREKDAM